MRFWVSQKAAVVKPGLYPENNLLRFQFSCCLSTLTFNNWPPYGSATQFCAKLWTFSPKYIFADAHTPSAPSTRSTFMSSTRWAPGPPLHSWNDSCKSDFVCANGGCVKCLCQSVATVWFVTYFCWLSVCNCLPPDVFPRTPASIVAPPPPQSVPRPPLFGITHRPTCCMGRGWHRWTAC